jgi:uncharacterized membrane protein
MYNYLLFFIYSVIGYIVEVISVSLINKKITFSRGYLIGPYLPIFGTGSMLINLFLTKYKNDIITLFVMGVVVCCVLEYFTSLIMEKIFKLRWWDYSSKKFNLNGRICLETGALFGLGGILIVYVINPLLTFLLNLFSNKLIIIIGLIILIIMFIDFILSTFTIIKLKVDLSRFKNCDATAMIREEIKKDLFKYRYFHNRLFKAFPEITKRDAYIINIKNMLKKHKESKQKKD